LYQAQGAPLLNPAALRAPGLGRALLVALTFYAIGVFFLLFSIYLQGALHTSPLSAGLVFLPFGAGFLLGPLATHLFRRLLGSYVNPFGMALEVLGFVLLAWLVAHTPTAVTPSALSLAVILFLIGFGQGLALPTLMRMITGRVAPAYSGMIAGITSSTLQISTALSVAIIGGIFYTLLGKDTDAAAITHAFTVAILCIAACLVVGAGLSLSLARQSAAELQTAAMQPAE
jgi:MFS family permease